MNRTFSVLDARSHEWKRRRQWWIDRYNIQSEKGREDLLTDVGLFNKKRISVFDAYLTELVYTWFLSKSGNKVLDPFAGGSVRGIVCNALGHQYTGIDISSSQVDANRLQSDEPQWIVGNADTVLDSIYDDFDLVFTCPPYHNLEVYSDNKEDLSNQDYETFLINYGSIIKKSVSKLKDNRFFVIVVSEIRDYLDGYYTEGFYKGLVKDTQVLAEQSGLHYYNELILLNATGNAALMENKYFNKNKKFARVHQNVLVFVKGNPDLATIELSDDDYICEIDGVKYKSFRHAAISIDPHKQVPSRIEKKCRSNKPKYDNWRML